MQVKILDKKTNRLLHRDEYVLEVTGIPITPKRKELLPKIAETINTKPEFVAIQKVEQKFGSQENKVWARAYENAESLSRIELKHLVGRDKGEKVKHVKKKKEDKK